MPITVTCTCGKKFRTADANAGKKAKCSGCGKTIVIPQPVAAKPADSDDLFSLAEPEHFTPADPDALAIKPVARSGRSLPSIAPPLGKTERGTGSSRVPSITLSPGIIILIVAAILIPALIFYIKEGPVKAQREWADMKQLASDNISGLVARAINHQYKAMGINMNDPNDPHPQAQVTNIYFDEPIIMLSLPKSITFQGSTNEGTLRGTFHPRTKRFEADVEIENVTHRVTGSIDPKQNTFTFDGKLITGE